MLRVDGDRSRVIYLLTTSGPTEKATDRELLGLFYSKVRSSPVFFVDLSDSYIRRKYGICIHWNIATVLYIRTKTA